MQILKPTLNQNQGLYFNNIDNIYILINVNISVFNNIDNPVGAGMYLYAH